MRIALLSWETLHSIPVGGVGVHVTELAAALERKGHEVHVYTRMGFGQSHYDRIEGVHYHRCPFDLSADFIEEINNMCRSFVDQRLSRPRISWAPLTWFTPTTGLPRTP